MIAARTGTKRAPPQPQKFNLREVVCCKVATRFHGLIDRASVDWISCIRNLVFSRHFRGVGVRCVRSASTRVGWFGHRVAGRGDRVGFGNRAELMVKLALW